MHCPFLLFSPDRMLRRRRRMIARCQKTQRFFFRSLRLIDRYAFFHWNDKKKSTWIFIFVLFGMNHLRSNRKLNIVQFECPKLFLFNWIFILIFFYLKNWTIISKFFESNFEFSNYIVTFWSTMQV